MKIKRIDDLDKERKEREKREMSKEIADVFKGSLEDIEDYFKRKRIAKEIANKEKYKYC